jgi:hypothetical protein
MTGCKSVRSRTETRELILPGSSGIASDVAVEPFGHGSPTLDLERALMITGLEGT